MLIWVDICINRSLTSTAALWVFTTWDIISDALLVILPIGILMGADLPRQQKRQAGIRFSAVCIVPCLSVLRASSSYAVTGMNKALWLHTWGIVQLAVFASIVNILAVLTHRAARLRGDVASLGSTESPALAPPSSDMLPPLLHSRSSDAILPPLLHPSVQSYLQSTRLQSAFSWTTISSHATEQS